jgi:hypothetical protein
LLLLTALRLYPGIPILEVLAEEIRRTKTPYKPAWMPFAEDRYMLLENSARSSKTTVTFFV